MSTEAKEIDVPVLTPSDGQGKPLLATAQTLPFLGGLKVKLTARLGETELSVTELTALKAGATVALDRLVNQPIDLLAEGHLVAQGTLVAVGEHFGVRITSQPRLQ